MPSRSTPAHASPITALRRLAIIQFPFAFILLLAHGLASNKALPAIGLLPLSLSALLSALILYRDNVSALGSSVQALTASNLLYLDILLAFFQLSLLIPTWIQLSNSWYHASLVILGTYGSVFMMVNCGIHFYFALKELWHMSTSHLCHCPHCQSLRASRSSSLLPLSNEYTPLQNEDSNGTEYHDVEAGVDANVEARI
ncbi:hypothetical protein BKA67DRAFT_10211 [Truncatella angustata]|uniref:Uncharacterized protein n=1 Tax=Truncatella angustata TaxID=152316 RepID=A0A9P8UUD1_9PEZI|nr:uncharacterized protein BKA67DRAFT_10211 [Truncatella angustata]KAH6659304.1 hypothetical protein BKA67DRAFT_10211 [Truncatella angustata]